MSGGSWNYLFRPVQEAGKALFDDDTRPERQVFGELLLHVAFALHEIEWVDSGDKGPPADVKAIHAVFDYLSNESYRSRMLKIKQAEERRRLLDKLAEVWQEIAILDD